MKNILFLVILLSLFSCQNTTNEKTDVETINVTEFKNQTIAFEEMVSSVEMLKLHTDTTGYIGQIEDVAAIDPSLYILDVITSSIFQFNRKDGTLLHRISTRGKGPLEYIQPMALTTDSNHLYVLDVPGMAILSYNKNLQAERKISITFPCLDFIRTKQGFLCYNAAPTETLKQIVYLDQEGKIIDSYQLDNFKNGLSAGAKIFTQDAQGKIFVTTTFSRVIYGWNESLTRLEKLKTFDFASYNIPSDMEVERVNIFQKPYAIPSQFFHIKNAHLRSFIYRSKRYYCLKSTSDQKIGTIRGESAYPFFPRWQIGDCLIGTCSEDFFSSESSEEAGEVLLFYSLK